MAFQKYIFYFILWALSFNLMAQKFGFNKILKENPSLQMPFSVENNSSNLRFLKESGVDIKRVTDNYIFITQTPEWIFEQYSKKNITNFYFEYSPPTLLADTARKWHHVDSVHAGASPLLDKYTGKDVLIGIVDSGLDYDHPDFIDAYGKKRVIRYWNHSVENPTVSPQPYNYGQIFYEAEIQAAPNTTTSNANLGHGTTVAGICAGNGLANGTNKGMAPEADIIFVETNFSLPNWTLTVADACDYIFRVADSLNKPAVINLSIGSSLGSHDGTDPAGELMGALVDEKPGRIIIGAAGNSGNEKPFHAQQYMSPTDTNFIWFKNNPDGALGPNTVFFDLWSNTDAAEFNYSFSANRGEAGNYTTSASTIYRYAQESVGTAIFDTLYNANGNQVATLEIYTGYEADNFHMQAYFSKVDSTDYYIQFNTTGGGKYDLWTGLNFNLNEIVTSLPTPAEHPSIVKYVYPDSAQSIVSSWNCSPKILSVANFRNRLGHIDNNGDMYYPADMTIPGKIAASSSRGPARSGITKPDISASGELSLGSAPLYVVGNPAYNSALGEGGYHARNGGTSMASPIVAGIAALYLERCPNSTAQEFMNDLFNTAYEDQYTGDLPNNRFGYGKAHAFDLLVSRNGDLQIIGDTIICELPIVLSSNTDLLDYNWSNGSHSSEIVVSQPDTVYLYGSDGQGCKIYSDTIVVEQGSTLPNPTITIVGNTLVSSEAPSYQWYLNDHPIQGATEQSYTPTQAGFYSVAIQGDNGCLSFSNAIEWTLGVSKQDFSSIHVYPNPTNNYLTIKAEGQVIKSIEVTAMTGQQLIVKRDLENQESFQLNVAHLSSGNYILKVITTQKMEILSFFKE